MYTATAIPKDMMKLSPTGCHENDDDDNYSGIEAYSNNDARIPSDCESIPVNSDRE